MEDAGAIRTHAAALADAIEQALPDWVVRSTERLVLAYHGSVPPDVAADAATAGEAAAREVGALVRRLLEADIDDQRTTPLAIVRSAVSYPTAALQRAGVPPVDRDEFAQRAFPDDLYDLAPASFADLDPSVHEPGLLWGAAKAHVHLVRRRAKEHR